MKTRLIFFALLALAACKETEDSAVKEIKKTAIAESIAPSFNSDSAYAYIQQQVDFGPRVPNTLAHDSCAEMLISKLRSFNLDVQTQTGEVTVYDGSKVNFINIIASSNIQAINRILLCSHWDTRPIADRDFTRQDEPIPGANDGGSSTGVLLEIARHLVDNPTNVGIDLVFFDVEDYGKSNVNYSYCLGSQYWSKTPHKKGYYPKYGILLDMVGARNAKFYMEGNSMKFAPHIVKNVWNTAARLGYGDQFIAQRTNPLTDDHLYVNTIANIPCIDIIQQDLSTPTNFGSYWHTHNDNMKVIDRATLKAVGQTVLEVIYNEK